MFNRSVLAACALTTMTAIALAQTTPATPPAQPGQRSAPEATQAQPRTGQAQPGTAQKPVGLKEIEALQLTFYTVQPADVLMSNLMGVNVYNAQNETVGEIEDAIIDNGKMLRALVLGVGGFLGLGERYVSVEPKSVLLSRDANGDLRAYVNTTRETLRNAPEFKYEGVFSRRQVGAAPTQPGTTGGAGTTGAGTKSGPSGSQSQPSK